MTNTLPITRSEKRNFDTLVSAAKSDRLPLMSCVDDRTNQPVAVLCAVNYGQDLDVCFEFVPLAILCAGNSYSYLQSPTGGCEQNSLPHGAECDTITNGE